MRSQCRWRSYGRACGHLRSDGTSCPPSDGRDGHGAQHRLHDEWAAPGSQRGRSAGPVSSCYDIGGGGHGGASSAAGRGSPWSCTRDESVLREERFPGITVVPRTPPRSVAPGRRSGLWRTRRTGFRPACCGRCWHPTAGLSRPISCCSEPSYVNSLLATREGSP